MSKIGLPARCKQTEVEGFLLSCTNLKIKAEPSFFCPLTGSLLLSPVRLVNSGSTFEAASLSEYFRRAGRKRCPISGRNLDRDWVVIEPDDELRARIHAWAREKRLNLDALEVAAYKLREPRSKMLRTLSDHDIFEAAFSSSQSLPRMVNVPIQRPGKMEEHYMSGRLGRLGQHQMPRPCAVDGAARQLERPRSRSVPRDTRCSA
ncbi:g3167 [Coccomyxa viridis]|uniref:G3167 protein n=1 Tax=Coccomyxa viridis TaxID=1274662 RepID=A0ABP1FQN2_9CHLO